MNSILTHLVLPNSGINIYIPTHQFIANSKNIRDADGIPLDIQLDSEEPIDQIIQAVKESGL